MNTPKKKTAHSTGAKMDGTNFPYEH